VRLPFRRRRQPSVPTPNSATAGGEPRATELDRIVGWLDERTGVAEVARVLLRKVFPDHWSFLLGEIALFCYVVLVATGLYLTFFFTADTQPVVYEGSYAPLQGAEVSAAFDSVMRLSFDVRAGLLMRQVHHWAALVFVAAIVVHVSRVFFTGAFRRPREINWLIGVSLLLMALAAGFTGYSLPDDLLSGTGLRIVYSVAFSIPFIGPWAAYIAFGGEFPPSEMIGRLYVFHIMLLPLLMIGAITVHLGIVFLQKHTQFPGGQATETNVVGRHLWPGQAFRSLGLFFVTAAVLALMGGIFQINPVWVYGPYVPSAAASPAQPDWYLGWLEGLLRLGPNWEPTILGVTIPSPFLPGIVLPGIIFGGLAFWPFIEARINRDHRDHHLLQYPWQAPLRLAIGSAVLTLFVVLTLAGANDLLAVLLNVGVEELTTAFRVLAVVGPIAVALIAYRLALEIGGRSGRPLGPDGGYVLRRTADGGFEEVEP
jgi:ubiquinol-cytochrome c reductase cytochrome b subunit